MSRLSFSLENLPVTRKLGLGFGFVLLLVAVLAIVGIKSLDASRQHIEKINAAAEIGDALDKANFARLEFARSRDVKLLSEVETQNQRILTLLQNSRNLSWDVEDEQIILMMPHVVEQYSALRAGLEKAHEDWWAARRRMIEPGNKLVPALRELTDQLLHEARQDPYGENLYEQADVAIAVGSIAEQFAMLRYQVRGLVMNEDAKSEESSLKALDDVRKSMDALLPRLQGDAHTRLQNIIALLGEYRAGVVGFLPVVLQRDDLASQMSDIVTSFNTISHNVFQNELTRSREAAERNGLLMIILSVTAVVLGVLAAWLIGRQIVRPLRRTVTLAEQIAHGDLTHTISSTRRDELGQLQQAMHRMQQFLARTVSTVRSGVREINTGAQEIASGNADLSSRSEQQAASLEETAASMEQLASTVKNNADNANQATSLANEASSVAVRGGEVVGRVVSTMHGISDSSRRIADIIGVIESIAFQTNILALNAAVEAARAGEQGKGFAVVASEVRSLAQRSAGAAKEIKTLIDDSVDKVTAGSSQVQQAAVTMEDIVKSVRRVSDLIEEISAASREQATGIDQVNQAVGQMDHVTQQNASLVEQAAAASASLEEQATRLAQAVAVFKTEEGDDDPVLAATQTAPVRRATVPTPAPVARKAPRAAPAPAVRREPTVKPALSAPAAAPAKFTAPARKAAAPVAQSRKDDDDWDTF
ncbi:HAMP domain-containing protein [Alcaligenaceae bacterium SJ-26]|nr:HAMP domain-containing protein [Alcaligenaceae bacterium SJ-26]